MCCVNIKWFDKGVECGLCLNILQKWGFLGGNARGLVFLTLPWLGCFGIGGVSCWPFFVSDMLYPYEMINWCVFEGLFHSLHAGHSLKAVDVVCAALSWVARTVVLVAFLHIFEHRITRLVHLSGASSEVGAKEGGERGGVGHRGRKVSRLFGVGRHQRMRRVDLEAFGVGVSQLARGENCAAFEGVSGHKGRMRVIGDPFPRTPPRSRLRQSLLDFLGAIGRVIVLGSHFSVFAAFANRAIILL